VLLKLSGEAIAKKGANGETEEIFDCEIIDKITDVIKKMVDDGVQVGIVIGAGNIWRGALGKGVTRARADHMGMLATMINCLRLQDAIEKKDCKATVMTPITMNGFAEPYDFGKAVAHLKEGTVVIFGAGTGIPFVSTDTTAVVRAAEIDADVILMAKNIDAIYSADPKKDPTATRYEELTYDEIVERDLRALDMTATIFCRDNGIRCYAFGLSDPENIYRVVMGERIGTEIHN
jgi:uridylate kinase